MNDFEKYVKENEVIIPKWLERFIIITDKTVDDLPIGVSINPTRTKKKQYKSSITHDGKNHFIGYFMFPDEARDEWLNAKLNILHEHKKELDIIDDQIYPMIVHLIFEQTL